VGGVGPASGLSLRSRLLGGDDRQGRLVEREAASAGRQLRPGAGKQRAGGLGVLAGHDGGQCLSHPGSDPLGVPVAVQRRIAADLGAVEGEHRQIHQPGRRAQP